MEKTEPRHKKLLDDFKRLTQSKKQREMDKERGTLHMSPGHLLEPGTVERRMGEFYKWFREHETEYRRYRDSVERAKLAKERNMAIPPPLTPGALSPFITTTDTTTPTIDEARASQNGLLTLVRSNVDFWLNDEQVIMTGIYRSGITLDLETPAGRMRLTLDLKTTKRLMDEARKALVREFSENAA
jgi:hypothetical protein